MASKFPNFRRLLPEGELHHPPGLPDDQPGGGGGDGVHDQQLSAELLSPGPEPAREERLVRGSQQRGGGTAEPEGEL